MIRLLRDLAETWADQRFVKANDVLRRKLITAEASVERLKQERARLQNAVRSYGQLCQSSQQMRQQAEAERDAALKRVVELEQTVVAMSAQDAPEDKHRCPEGLLVDGVELHRCIRNGGHEGNHWNRGHEREWAPLPEVDNIEVPW